jgi:alpha-1,6-mannosyltransferase
VKLGSLALGILVAAMLGIAAHDDLRRDVGVVLLLLLGAAAAHAVLCHLAERGRGVGLGLVVGVAVVLRVCALAPREGLSDDLHRYAFEGRVLAAGLDPYRLAPDDPALASLRDERVWPRVTHRDVPAAYPPLAQAAFARIAACETWVDPLFALRFLFVIADLATIAVLIAWLAREGLPRARVAIYALAPLPIVEFAATGHLDALALPFVVAAIARTPGAFGAVLLGLAALVKPQAAVLLPLVLGRGALLRPALAFVTVIALGWLPFLDPWPPLEGLRRYAEQWTFGAPFEPALRVALESVRDAGFDAGSGAITRFFAAVSPSRLARLLLGAIFVAVWIAILRSRSSRSSRAEQAVWILAALMLASPTIWPWYLTWLLPFLALRLEPSLLLWVAVGPLAYHVLPAYDGFAVFRESPLLRFAQYAPVLVWIAVRVASAGVLASSSRVTGAAGLSSAATGVGAPEAARTRAGSKDPSPHQ